MRYFKGDIIETLTLSQYQASELTKCNKLFFETAAGLRFYVNGITDDGKLIIEHPYANTYSGVDTLYLNPKAVMLYHRPFKNWLKMLFTPPKNNFR